MAETIPSDLIISDVSITNFHKTYVTESISGIQYARDSGVQQFKGSITLTSSGFEGAKKLNGFIARLKGRLNEFEIELGGAFANTDISIDPSLNSTANFTDVINVSAFAGSTITSGSVFNFGNETKLYTVLEDIPVSGNPSTSIVPSTKSSLSVGTKLNFVNPTITAILNANNTTMTHIENGYITMATLEWSEKLY